MKINVYFRARVENSVSLPLRYLKIKRKQKKTQNYPKETNFLAEMCDWPIFYSESQSSYSLTYVIKCGGSHKMAKKMAIFGKNS